MKSKTLLVANVLASAYVIYLIIQIATATSSSDAAEAIAGAIVGTVIKPHMIMFAVGAGLGWFGWATGKAWGALVGSILYAIGTILMLLFVMYALPITVLGFVGFAMQNKLSKSK